jgi:hypothetical protein
MTNGIYADFKKQLTHKFNLFFPHPKKLKPDIIERNRTMLRKNMSILSFIEYTFFDDKLKLIFQPSATDRGGQYDYKKKQIEINDKLMWDTLISLKNLAAEYNFEIVGKNKDKYLDLWYEANAEYQFIMDDHYLEWVDTLTHELQHYLDDTNYNMSKMKPKVQRYKQQVEKKYDNLTPEELKNIVYYNTDFEINAFLFQQLSLLNQFIESKHLVVNNVNEFVAAFQKRFPVLWKYLDESNKKRVLKRIYEYWTTHNEGK